MDQSFTISKKIKNEEEFEHLVKENNKGLWLEGDIKRYNTNDSAVNKKRKTIKEGNNWDMGIHFIMDTL